MWLTTRETAGSGCREMLFACAVAVLATPLLAMPSAMLAPRILPSLKKSTGAQINFKPTTKLKLGSYRLSRIKPIPGSGADGGNAEGGSAKLFQTGYEDRKSGSERTGALKICWPPAGEELDENRRVCEAEAETTRRVAAELPTVAPTLLASGDVPLAGFLEPAPPRLTKADVPALLFAELAAGGPLQGMFDRGQWEQLVSREGRLAVIREFFAALRAVHAAGFYHGDLTTNNVLLRREFGEFTRIHGEETRLLFIDWALGGDSSAPTSGELRVPSVWRAPEAVERVDGQRIEGQPLDVWAAGIDLYLMIFQRAPVDVARSNLPENKKTQWVVMLPWQDEFLKEDDENARKEMIQGWPQSKKEIPDRLLTLLEALLRREDRRIDADKAHELAQKVQLDDIIGGNGPFF